MIAYETPPLAYDVHCKYRQINRELHEDAMKGASMLTHNSKSFLLLQLCKPELKSGADVGHLSPEAPSMRSLLGCLRDRGDPVACWEVRQEGLADTLSGGSKTWGEQLLLWLPGKK